MTALEKLLSISSAPISQHPALVNLDNVVPLGEQLEALLRLRNGFYAFESALHVFPAASYEKEQEMTLSHWNSPQLWRFEYGELTDKILFFAEDAFGNQFCLYEGRICSFDAETGEREVLADSLEQWAKRLLAEYPILTGHPVMHKWQKKNGSIPLGTRLMPKIPFVLGGEYSLGNLYALEAVRAMKSRGNLARQLKDLPDGARVEFRIIE